ncbi:hypothetical protein M6D81_14625 [Paenibacillus sp. J5C_2022]|uniref:alcohol dehydrogenase catalytic domain-containing protein n=1 Tax=Paenibacillus sp. J5C2022 TaxID=2977129 RepID=UPI0021CED5E1|nr:hypothetical protein [Paenibacillus sp. J5C2022]MCU6709927.1 hypothetical protein [Paenibacillus sp. J5C2022]
MKGYAVVFPDKLKVEYAEVRLPAPGPNDLLIDVAYSWISIGTESSFLRGERAGGETPYESGMPWPFPQVPGYQKTGIVRSVGSDVRGFSPGDSVFVSGSKVNHMYGFGGGHVNPAIAESEHVWKLPAHVPLEAFAGLVLTQVGYNCGTASPLRAGECAVVIGDGLVGQWTAQTLANRGALVVVLGRHKERLRLLPDNVSAVHVRQQEPEDVIYPGGISVIVDTVGDLDMVMRLEPKMVRGSHLVSAGYLGNKGMIDIQKLRKKEITLYTPSGMTRQRMDATIQGISDGWLNTIPLITHRFPAEYAAKAWKLILAKQEPFLGILLEWDDKFATERVE